VSREDAGRYERERRFHDERFADDTRSANRFYVIDKSAGAAFEARIGAVPPGSFALDYGCGAGAYASIALAKRGSRSVAVDISAEAINQAREKAEAEGVGDRIEFRVMNAESLDLPDSSFDFVCGNGVLHHLDLERAYGELARVLKPDGNGVFLEPMGHNPVINLYRRRTPEQRTPDEHPLVLGDFDLARRHFEGVDGSFFALAALLLLPLARSRLALRLLPALDALDRGLFRLLPFLRRFAWLVVLDLRRPIHPARAP
jgi:SAM-dependent methyltransferase